MIDVLIPTYSRKTGLAITLASLFGQTFHDFSITVADQTPDDERYIESPEIETLIAAFRWRGVALASDERLAFIPAPLVGVRHSVGAGDSFTAGVALGLAAGCDLIDAVSLGVLAGSVSVTKPHTSVVTLSELLATVKSARTPPSEQACR